MAMDTSDDDAPLSLHRETIRSVMASLDELVRDKLVPELVENVDEDGRLIAHLRLSIARVFASAGDTRSYEITLTLQPLSDERIAIMRTDKLNCLQSEV